MEAEVTAAAGAAPMAVEVVASTVGVAVAVFTAAVAASAAEAVAISAAGVVPTEAAHLRRVPTLGVRRATTADTAAIPAAFRVCRDSIAAAAQAREWARVRAGV